MCPVYGGTAVLMKRISVEELQSGMRLAKPVIKDSMTLLGEGTELTDRLIARIQAMNIADVVIDAPGEGGSVKETLLSNLDRVFRDRENEPYMGLIKRLVREHIEQYHE